MKLWAYCGWGSSSDPFDEQQIIRCKNDEGARPDRWNTWAKWHARDFRTRVQSFNGWTAAGAFRVSRSALYLLGKVDQDAQAFRGELQIFDIADDERGDAVDEGEVGGHAQLQSGDKSRREERASACRLSSAGLGVGGTRGGESTPVRSHRRRHPHPGTVVQCFGGRLVRPVRWLRLRARLMFVCRGDP